MSFNAHFIRKQTPIDRMKHSVSGATEAEFKAHRRCGKYLLVVSETNKTPPGYSLKIESFRFSIWRKYYRLGKGSPSPKQTEVMTETFEFLPDKPPRVLLEVLSSSLRRYDGNCEHRPIRKIMRMSYYWPQLTLRFWRYREIDYTRWHKVPVGVFMFDTWE